MARKLFCLFTGIIIATGFLFEPACAQDRVSIQVEIICADTSKNSIEPSLDHLRLQLTRLNYTFYQLLEKKVLRLALQEQGQVSLPNGKVLYVKPLSVEKGFVRMNVMIREDGLNTDFKLANKGSVIVGGTSYKGGVLIIALSVRH